MAASYFTDDSMIRRIHGERAVALSGPRALLMQAAHPLAVAGLLAHSSAVDEPYERLARTAQVMNTIAFGSRRRADRMTAHVREMHARVRGRLRAPAGPYPAGTPYRADDPELLLWVLYTLVDSGLVLYEHYVGSLRADEQEAYWQDFRVVGRLFGLAGDEMPATLPELRAYGRDMLGSGRLVVTEWSRRRARRIVLDPPVPVALRPAVELANFVTIALLPDEIRRQYGFAPVPPAVVRKVLVRAGAEYVRRAVMPLLPPSVRLVPSARAA